MDTGLRAALAALGGSRPLAALLKVTRQAVEQWAKIPAEHVQKIAAATGNRVTPQMMRPDLYLPVQSGDRRALARLVHKLHPTKQARKRAAKKAPAPKALRPRSRKRR